MAILGFDHVIVIGRDLDALVPLAEGATFELLAVWEPAPETRRWAMLAAGGGLCEFMLSTDDVAADVRYNHRAAASR